MTAEIKKIDNKTELRKSIETLYQRMLEGDVEAIVCVYERKGCYEHFRSCLRYEEAIGLLARGMYKLNQEWDQGK